MLPATFDCAKTLSVIWANIQLVHCELVPGIFGINNCIIKLDELPIDLGLVNPNKDKDINPLGSVEFVGVTFILKISIELTKTKFKNIGLYYIE